MIGKDYFDVRSRLMAALEDLRELAKEVGVDPRQLAVTGNLSHTLRDPFVFVVTGEVNVGKSTLLNALFGDEFCSTGVMPTTDKIHFFKYGAKLKRVPITETLQEVHVPAEFLKDFHVVDTPGTNSIESEHQEITERFLPTADMAIFVFSAMNPWGASAWQFLDKVHRQWMRNVVFVLQQCDLRAPEEIEAIKAYMKQLCKQRFGREFTLFPVSGKKAFLARSSGLDRERLLAESGIDALEEYISRSIGGAGTRVNKLGMALRIAQDLHGSVHKLVGGRDEEHEERKRVLTGLEHSLSSLQARAKAKLGPAMEATGKAFAQASETLLDKLKRWHTPDKAAKRFFARKVWDSAGMERRLIEDALATSADRWEQAALILEGDVEQSSTHFGTAVRDRLRLDLPDDGLKPQRSFWDAHRRRFKDRLEELHREIARGLKLETFLETEWRAASRQSLCAFFVIFLGLIGGCAVIGAAPDLTKWKAVAMDINGWRLTGAAVVALGLAAGLTMRRRCASGLIRLTNQVADKLAAARMELREKLDVHLADELRVVYSHFDGALRPVRARLTEQESRHHELVKKVKDLGATLGRITKDQKALASVRKE